MHKVRHLRHPTKVIHRVFRARVCVTGAVVGDRHACPDCGASHAIRAPKRVAAATSAASHTDLRASRCPHCRQPVLEGRVDALDRLLETQPINELGFLTYRNIGRTIVDRHEQRARNTSYATSWPPKDWHYFHIIHECGNPIPALLQENNVTRHKRIVTLPENPPF